MAEKEPCSLVEDRVQSLPFVLQRDQLLDQISTDVWAQVGTAIADHVWVRIRIQLSALVCDQAEEQAHQGISNG